MTKKDFFLFSFIIIALLLLSALPYIFFGFLLGGTSSELICYSSSPNGDYTVNAYLVNGGATVDFSVEAYLINNDKKGKRIYNAYHERTAEIIWIDDKTVRINGKTLDLSIGETYDWCKE